MLSRGTALFLMVWFTICAQNAQAFFDPPWITPENPIAGETVYVNIHGGTCSTIIEEQGYPQIVQEGNTIRMRWYGIHWPEGSGLPLCSYPIGTFTPPLGAYPAGSYTLTVELAYIDYFDGPSILTIGVIPFTVTEPRTPVSVPTLGAFGMLILVAMLLIAALMSLRRRRASWLVIALMVLPWWGEGRAEDTGTIRVLLSEAPGAPAAATVVAWVNSPSSLGTPPLHAFTVRSLDSSSKCNTPFTIVGCSHGEELSASEL